MAKRRFNTKWDTEVFDRLDFICKQKGRNRSRTLEDIIAEKFNILQNGHTVGHTNAGGDIGGKLDTLCLSINTLVQEIQVNKRKRIKNEKPEGKKEYEKGIELFPEEYDKLCLDFGKEKTDKAIKFLSQYKAEKNYKTNDCNLTLRRWVFKAIEKTDKADPGTEQVGKKDYNATKF